MKKLVTAFAACLTAGLVSAAVESQNIVGYMNTTGANGFTMYTPMFTAVGGGTNTLGSIKGNFMEYADTLQILDANLVMTTQYTWEDLGSGPVWTADNVTDNSNVIIPIGSSVVISSSAATILNSGEVKLTATTVTCGSGFTTLGNPLPKAITLGAITFTGLTEYSDTLQILNQNLVMTTQYTWEDLGSGPVWTADNVTDNSGTVLNPGDGFVLSSSGSTVTFPAPL